MVFAAERTVFDKRKEMIKNRKLSTEKVKEIRENRKSITAGVKEVRKKQKRSTQKAEEMRKERWIEKEEKTKKVKNELDYKRPEW